MNSTTIEITIEEYTRLKDIETRFEIIKRGMLHATYIPIHEQIVLGIEAECAAKPGIKFEPLPKKKEGK